MASVNYEVSDKEVIDSYWLMLRTSKVYLKKVLVHALFFLIFPMLIELAISKSISIYSICIGVVFVCIYPVMVIFLARKMAKKGSKTISVSAKGMDVSIGVKNKLIDWKQVGGIEESDKYLFVLSNAGNFMCIPKRAFSNESVLTEFKTVVQTNA
ncbi:MAG: YcxB family protein [Alteromonadaceae bacterium]|nr:YcxB family protein [Alteromonadaceae bacterium]